MKLFRLLPIALLLLGTQACVPAEEAQQVDESDLCDQARAKLLECFPDQTPGDSCHGATAQQILDESCEELASHDGKSDGGWICFWNPWLCSGGSSETPTYALTVGTSRCGTSILGGNDCHYYSSSSCTTVAVYQEGVEITRGHTGRHGTVRFEFDEPGEYEVRVLDRNEEVADQLRGFVTYEASPAIRTVTFGESREERFGFNLSHDSQELMQRCAPVTVELGAQTLSGEPVVAQDVEWDWLIRFQQANGTEEVKRAFAIHPDATGEEDFVNRAHFHWTYGGDHIVEFVRVNIPEWQRRPNPDYEDLLRRYAVSSVQSLEEPYTLLDEDIPSGDKLSIVLIDPLRE